jgi:hypothetical protein
MDPGLSDLATFLYGSLGGALAFIAIFALPELRAAWQAKDFNFGWKPAAIVSLIFIVQSILGGAAAILVGDATLAKQAIAYGLAAEGIIGGYIKGST